MTVEHSASRQEQPSLFTAVLYQWKVEMDECGKKTSHRSVSKSD